MTFRRPEQYRVKTILILLLLIPATFASGQTEEADTAQADNFGWLAYPYVFMSPETNLAFGVGGILYFRFSPEKTVKPSSITPSGYYSINDQYDVTIIPEFYLGKKFYIYSYFSFGRYIDKFYGTGPGSEEIGNPDYAHHSLVLQLNLQPQISDEVRAGLYARVLFRTITDPMTNPFILGGTVTGSDGGTSVGLGGVVAWDTRNHRFYPTAGHLNELRAVFYSKAWGSSFDYNKYEVDLRAYSAIGEGDRHVIGGQVYGIFTFGNGPFYDIAMLGGKTIMRGYYLGRYRDNDLLAGQVEYRTRLFWRIGLIGFLGAGQVMSKPSEFRVNLLQYSYGFGLRYQFDLTEKIDVRADFGFGKGTSGVYFDVQQAF
jgi:outer membrane protein assembly factor BamA